MKTRAWPVVLALMLLQSTAASQEPYEQGWCKNFGLFFHQATSWREQGTTIKQSFEIMAQAHRQKAEGATPLPQDAAQTFETITMGIVVHVYKHPMYSVFGPEMNRNMAQSRCERVGAENFVKEIDTTMRKLLSQK